MSQKKELFKNIIIIGIGKISTQIITFLLLPLYTSKLTPGEYGQYDFIVTLSIFLLPVITILMEESMFRFLIDCNTHEKRQKVISHTIIYIVGSTFVFCLIGCFIVYLTHYQNGILVIIFIVSNVLIGLSNALSRGIGKIKLFSISNMVAGIINISLNIFFIIELHGGINGLLVSSIIANTVTAVFVFIRLHLFQYISFHKWDKKLLKEMIIYSIPLVPNSISWSVINLSDRFVITFVLGSAANGIYSISNKFPSVMNALYGFFYIAWKESAAKIVKEEQSSKYYVDIYEDLKNFLYAVSIGIIALIPLVFSFLIGENYVDAYAYIPILILAMFYSNVAGFYGGIFSAYKETKIMGTTTVLAAIINLTVNLALIHYIGIYAAALSTLISNYVVYAYRKRKVKKYVVLSEKKNIWTLGILVIVCITYYWNQLYVNIFSAILAVVYSYYLNKTLVTSLWKNIRLKVKNKI